MKLQELKEIAGSISFWVIVVNAVVFYLQQKGLIGEEELKLVTAIAVPFVTINQGRKIAKDLGKTEAQSVVEIKEEKKEEKLTK
jgi:hypothetical protein